MNDKDRLEVYKSIDNDMVQFFFKRTSEHILRVSKNIIKFIGYDKSVSDEDIMIRGLLHDNSKFSEDEMVGYIFITDLHRYEDEGEFVDQSEAVEEVSDIAWQNHFQVNPHHPEYYENVNKMILLDMMEMVADWTAMSQELEQGDSARAWFEKNVPSRWKFNKENQKIISDLIDYLDKK